MKWRRVQRQGDLDPSGPELRRALAACASGGDHSVSPPRASPALTTVLRVLDQKLLPQQSAWTQCFVNAAQASSDKFGFQVCGVALVCLPPASLFPFLLSHTPLSAVLTLSLAAGPTSQVGLQVKSLQRFVQCMFNASQEHLDVTSQLPTSIPESCILVAVEAGREGRPVESLGDLSSVLAREVAAVQRCTSSEKEPRPVLRLADGTHAPASRLAWATPGPCWPNGMGGCANGWVCKWGCTTSGCWAQSRWEVTLSPHPCPLPHGQTPTLPRIS
jgi:hypothetical protein